MYDTIPDSEEHRQAQAVLPREQLFSLRHLNPAAVLAYRTPLEQHPLSADGKATTLLTLVGLMFTIVGRFSGVIGGVLREQSWEQPLAFALLCAFSVLALGTVVQSFRTISPRFPKVPPSLAFFGDIARLSRDEYVAKVEALSGDAALDQMLLYNHTSALIAAEKFRQLRIAFRLFQGALVVWLALLAVVAWGAFRPSAAG